MELYPEQAMNRDASDRRGILRFYLVQLDILAAAQLNGDMLICWIHDQPFQRQNLRWFFIG